jgi:signal transduction histidine kinase
VLPGLRLPLPMHSLRARLLVLLLAVGLVPTLALGGVGLRVIAGLSGASTRAATSALEAKAQSHLLADVQHAAQQLGAEYAPAQQQAYDLAIQAAYIYSHPDLFPGVQQGNTPFIALADGDLVNQDPTIGVYAPGSAVLVPGFWQDVSLLSHIDPLLRSVVGLRCCLPPVVRYWVMTPAGLIRANPNPGFAADPPVHMLLQSVLMAYFAGRRPSALPAWQWGLWTLPYADPAAPESLVTAVVPIYDDAGGFHGLAGADVSVAALQGSLAALLAAPFSGAVLYRPVAGPALAPDTGVVQAPPPEPYPDAAPGQPASAFTLAVSGGAPDPAAFGLPSGSAGTRLLGSAARGLDVAYAPVGLGGWMLAEAAPAAAVVAQSDAAAVARRNGRIEAEAAALLAALVLALGSGLVLLARRASATVTEPLRRLTGQMRALGGPEGAPADGGGDEVAALSAEFAALTARLDAVTQRWRREAEERARAELAVLRSKGRIAREVHDTLAQAFLSIVLLAEGGRGRLAQVAEVARQGLRQARQSMAELAPGPRPGEEPPFVATVRAEADAFARSLRAPAEVCVRTDGWPDLPLPVQVALLGVLRSALGNVREHARARRVTVTLRGEPDAAVLEVADDGVGFAPGAPAARGPDRDGRGRGLPAMAERMAEVGGTLRVDSAPGRGTRVRAEATLRLAPRDEEGSAAWLGPPSAS